MPKECKGSSSFTTLDKIDYNIILLLIPGLENKEISKELGIPLSTIQRRTRNIIKNGLAYVIKIEPQKLSQKTIGCITELQNRLSNLSVTLNLNFYK